MTQKETADRADLKWWLVDDELFRLVKAVRDGSIQDPVRVREILTEAETSMATDLERWSRWRQMLDAAKEAFLRGWPVETANS